MTLLEFKKFFDDNIAEWNSFNMFVDSPYLFEGFTYGYSFTLKRFVLQYSFESSPLVATIRGKISTNHDNPKWITLDLILTPPIYLHLVLIGIIVLDFINLFIVLFTFASQDFYFISPSLKILTLSRNSLIFFNSILVINYLGFWFEFRNTQNKFQNYFPKIKLVEN